MSPEPGIRRSTYPKVLGAALSLGVVTAFALPPWGFWPLAPLGLAAMWWLAASTVPTLTSGRPPHLVRFWRSAQFWVWWSFWLGFHLVGLVWMIDLTVPGWILAVPVEAQIMALPFHLIGSNKRPIAMSPALVVGEAVRWVVPFGGVPMANLALAQVGAPWMSIVRISGALLLVAFVGLLAAVVVEAANARPLSSIALGGVAACVVVIAAVAPSGTRHDTATVAVVQAGGELGTNAVNDTQRSVFERHLDAMALLDTPVDLVLWSESSAQASTPLETSSAMAEIRSLADSTGATIIANFSERDGDFFNNAAVAVVPGEGLVSRYDKVHLVPFGEYVPLRSFIDNFVDLSLIPREAIPGTGPAVLDTPLGPVATVISFEVYFPERSREGVQRDGRLIVNPTLASSYTTSMVAEQSLASARLRAVEAGRWVLQASTTGYTAVVDASGDVVERTGLREQAVKTATVELRTGRTWAIRLGKWPITLAALAAIVAAAVDHRRRSDVDREGDRAVVAELDEHVGAEPAGRDT